jgi:hypothetical protein
MILRLLFCPQDPRTDTRSWRMLGSTLWVWGSFSRPRLGGVLDGPTDLT